MPINRSDYTQDNAMRDALITIDAADVVRFVGKNYEPEDVFEIKVLEAWAEDNGYIKADTEEE